MAKSGQKRKKAEKSKTQLKTSMKAAGKADKKKKVKGASGIKLPKGLNEVKPEVKTKVLTLTERAVPREKVELDKPGGKKYRPIQDVLSKLRHHSHFSRSDALKALKEILEECPHAIGAQRAEVLRYQIHSSIFLQQVFNNYNVNNRRLLPLAIDVEDQIRTLFVQVFSLLINVVSKTINNSSLKFTCNFVLFLAAKFE